jgi:hypothetical protein
LAPKNKIKPENEEIDEEAPSTDGLNGRKETKERRTS